MVMVFRLILLAAMLASSRAFADPIFSDGGTIGLEPPPGMAVQGHAFVKDGASIKVTSMSRDAYKHLEDARESVVRTGGLAARLDPFPVGPFPGSILRGRRMQGVDYRVWDVLVEAPDETARVSAMVPVGDTTISDAAIEAALRTIVVRPPGLLARLGALLRPPIAMATLLILAAASFCALFMAIGAWLFGPKPDRRRDASQGPGRGLSHGKG